MARQSRTAWQWPGHPPAMVTGAQRLALRRLVIAYVNGETPDLPDGEVTTGNVKELFRGTCLYGRVVLKGRAPGTTRLARPRAVV